MLFDLDGTLIDSAPDLAGAGNEHARRARAWRRCRYERLRPMVGSGARGMVGVALRRRRRTTPSYDALRDEFLRALRGAHDCARPRVFDDVPPLLRAPRARTACAWGIVTNKATRFAAPLVAGAAACARRRRRSSAATRRRTPSRIPRRCSRPRAGSASPPARCVYVGDDLRDVRGRPRRGHGAPWSPPGAIWAPATPIEAWGADAVIGAPRSTLLNWLATGLN